MRKLVFIIGFCVVYVSNICGQGTQCLKDYWDAIAKEMSENPQKKSMSAAEKYAMTFDTIRIDQLERRLGKITGYMGYIKDFCKAYNAERNLRKENEKVEKHIKEDSTLARRIGLKIRDIEPEIDETNRTFIRMIREEIERSNAEVDLRRIADVMDWFCSRRFKNSETYRLSYMEAVCYILGTRDVSKGKEFDIAKEYLKVATKSIRTLEYAKDEYEIREDERRIRMEKFDAAMARMKGSSSSEYQSPTDGYKSQEERLEEAKRQYQYQQVEDQIRRLRYGNDK